MNFTSRAEQYKWLTRDARLKTVTSGDYIRIRELGLFCLLETEMPHYDKDKGQLIRDGAVYQLLYLKNTEDEVLLLPPEAHTCPQQALNSFVKNKELLDGGYLGALNYYKDSLPSLLTTPYNDKIVESSDCHCMFVEIIQSLVGFEFPDAADGLVLDLTKEGRPILFTHEDVVAYRDMFYTGQLSEKPFIENPYIDGERWVLLKWEGTGFKVAEGRYAARQLLFGEKAARVPEKELSFYRSQFRARPFYQPMRGSIYVIQEQQLREYEGQLTTEESEVYEVSLAIRRPTN